MRIINKIASAIFALSCLFLDYQLFAYKNVFFLFLNKYDSLYLKDLVLIIFLVSSVLLLLNRFIALAAAVSLIKLLMISYDHYFFKEVYFDYLGLYLLILLVTNTLKDFNFNRLSYFKTCMGFSYFVAGLSKLIFYMTYKDYPQPLLISTNTITYFNFDVASNSVFLMLCLTQLILPILFMFKKTYFPSWAVLTAFQLMLLVTVNLTHITLVVLAFHLLCVEEEWLGLFKRKMTHATA